MMPNQDFAKIKSAMQSSLETQSEEKLSETGDVFIFRKNGF